MATAFSLSRLLASGASRALGLRQPSGSSRGTGLLPPAATFGARLPSGRQLGDGRLFAHMPYSGNGNSRGAHATTSATSARGGAASGGGKSHGTSTETKTKQQHAASTSELVFEPFEEVQAPLDEVRGSEGHDVSLAREREYTPDLEEAVNSQINVELTIRRDIARRPRRWAQRARAWRSRSARVCSETRNRIAAAF